MKKQDLAIITSKIIESLYNGMRVSTVDPHEYSTYNEREIAQDYRDLVYTLQEVELRNDARARRAGYIEIDESIRKKYKPQSFDEEVYYLADEFARPYNIFLRKDNPPYTSAIPENAKADRVIKHYQAFIYILFLDVKRRLVMMEPAVNTKGFKREKKNMIAKGQPTPDTIERGEEQFLYIKLFRYAKEIRRRLDLVNELQGLEKQERKYNILNWMLTKINGESGEFVKLCEDFPPEEYTFIYDSCCFEKEELESLESFVDMIRKEQKREEEDDYYCSWLQEKTEGHFKSLLVLYILVHKLKYELKDTRSLLESANYHPGKSKKESVGNIINMYGGGSYTDVHGNANVTLNFNNATENADKGCHLSDSVANQMDDSKNAPSHFGLDVKQRAHWVDVYSRLLTAKKIHADEVSSANFTYLMCGEGTAPLTPIRWYGSTRELAYMVRQYLGSQWDVAMFSFKNKKDKPLPKTFINSKVPSVKSIQIIDYIFR